jgi:enamine deaminase RidA (YjgF/YER057c/UK114 family)
MSRFELIETENVKSAEGRYYSPGLRVGDRLVLSGQVPLGPDGKTVSTDPAEQWKQCMANIAELVEAAGGTMDDVYRLDVFVVDIRHYLIHQELRKDHFSPPYPVSTAVEVSGLAREEWWFELEAEAYLAS